MLIIRGGLVIDLRPTTVPCQPYHHGAVATIVVVVFLFQASGDLIVYLLVVFFLWHEGRRGLASICSTGLLRARC